jgi:hypoxanthine phosphoribosyltransferase
MELIIKKEDIQLRIKQLALDIADDHIKTGNLLPPVMICILNGAYMFYTDLLRNMPINVQSDFIRLKSYEGQDNSGGIEILKGLEIDLKGRNVYIVDDICDTGTTILQALLMVNGHLPQQVKVITLTRRGGGVDMTDFCGFVIGDEWIAGYGLDNNGVGRNLEDLYKVN